MGKVSSLRQKILARTPGANINFQALCQLLVGFGFDMPIKGSHHIFSHPDIDDIINLQAVGSKAKPYQVKQVRDILIKYRIGESDDAQV